MGDADQELDALIAEITVDCYNEDEALTGFECAFDEEVRFPIPGIVVGEDVNVHAISQADGRRELLAICKRGDRTFKVALLDVEIATPTPPVLSPPTDAGSVPDTPPSRTPRPYQVVMTACGNILRVSAAVDARGESVAGSLLRLGSPQVWLVTARVGPAGRVEPFCHLVLPRWSSPAEGAPPLPAARRCRLRAEGRLEPVDDHDETIAAWEAAQPDREEWGPGPAAVAEADPLTGGPRCGDPTQATVRAGDESEVSPPPAEPLVSLLRAAAGSAGATGPAARRRLDG